LRVNYGAELRQVDFAKALENARQTINAWVADKTQGRIPELFTSGALSQTTLLALTNAVYFKGKWALPFDPAKTSPGEFTLSDGQKIETPMMRQSATVNYGENDQVQALEFPFEGRQLAMLFVLPRQHNQLSALEKALSGTYLDQILSQMHSVKVQIELPRLSLSAEFSLPKVLKAMGMTDAFTLPPADFSGMTGKKDLFVSEVIHKAMIEIYEEGAEAAAATGVTMSRGMVRPTAFQAKHPFLFLIRDQRSQGILFLGRVVDPRG